MTKIATEQDEVMSDRRLLPAPLGDQPCGQGVAEIMEPRMSARSRDDEILGEAAKRVIHSLLVERLTAAANEQPISESRMTATGCAVTTEGAHRGGMQWKQALGTEFCTGNQQRAGGGVEIGRP